MIDVQDVQLGERTVGILHFWEMREGAIGQPVIRRMAETNKDAGFIVAYHRILTQTTYATQMSMTTRTSVKAIVPGGPPST